MLEKLGKNVAVLGLGKSGRESALFLKKKGCRVFASDFSNNADTIENALFLKKNGIESEFGKHSNERILSSDWILISPGISPNAKIYQDLVKHSKPFYSEIEVASWFSLAKRTIALTGTCGKTTVSTLLSETLKISGEKVVFCGNIGNPWISEVERIDRETTVILELSSFQLENCKTFRPEIGILLNFYPNHLDWHKNMKEYLNAKLNLFKNMTEKDFMICAKEDTRKYFSNFKTKAKRIYFKKHDGSNPNEAVLLSMMSILQINNSALKKAVERFSGIEHRLEEFQRNNDVLFVNDSKSTTPASLKWALDKYKGKNVILIAGGKAKSKDFHDISQDMADLKKVILIGESKQMIAHAWKDKASIFLASSLEESCDEALTASLAGDVILFSPACASFDMFKNYQDRGRRFKEIICNRLKTKIQE